MNALADLAALGEPVKPVLDAGIYVEPRDKLPGDEFARQRAFVSFMRRHAPGCFVVAIPNGSKDSDWTRLRKHGEGAVGGMPDLSIYWNHGVFFAEFKSGTGRLKDSQVECLNRLHRLGFRVGVYRQAATLVEHLVAAGAPVGRAA